MFELTAQIFLISSCANRIAPRISSSLTSWAPASTIIIASFVPETVRCMRDAARSAEFGLMMYLPSTKPTTTEPVGPWKGSPAMDSATEEPIMA